MTLIEGCRICSKKALSFFFSFCRFCFYFSAFQQIPFITIFSDNLNLIHFSIYDGFVWFKMIAVVAYKKQNRQLDDKDARFPHKGCWSKKKKKKTCSFSCQCRKLNFFFPLSLFSVVWLFLCASYRHQRSLKTTQTLNRRTMILVAGPVSRLKMTSLLQDRAPGWADLNFLLCFTYSDVS